MIKYSLIALTAAAVLFSVGCEDSECCGVKSPTKNVAPVVTRVLGIKNGTTVTCVPGNTKNLSASANDTNDNLDTNTYVYKVDGVKVTNGTVDCPENGKTKEVCVTVKDDEGLESNEVCVTLKGQAAATSCNPHITMTDPANGNAETTTIVKGQKYDYHNNVVADDCPSVQCTWSVRSHKTEDNSFFTCLTNSSHVGTNDENPDFDVNEDGTIDANDHHVNLVGSGNVASINVQTCASLYDYFEVTLNCTNPTVNETKKYNLQ